MYNNRAFSLPVTSSLRYIRCLLFWWKHCNAAKSLWIPQSASMSCCIVHSYSPPPKNNLLLPLQSLTPTKLNNDHRFLPIRSLIPDVEGCTQLGSRLLFKFCFDLHQNATGPCSAEEQQTYPISTPLLTARALRNRHRVDRLADLHRGCVDDCLRPPQHLGISGHTDPGITHTSTAW